MDSVLTEGQAERDTFPLMSPDAVFSAGVPSQISTVQVQVKPVGGGATTSCQDLGWVEEAEVRLQVRLS